MCTSHSSTLESVKVQWNLLLQPVSIMKVWRPHDTCLKHDLFYVVVAFVGSVCVCVRVCMCVCVCVRACMHACVHACGCLHACMFISHNLYLVLK